jgi:hypothetical protein
MPHRYSLASAKSRKKAIGSGANGRPQTGHGLSGTTVFQVRRKRWSFNVAIRIAQKYVCLLLMAR